MADQTVTETPASSQPTFTAGPWKVGGEWPQIVAIYDNRCLYIGHANTGAGGEWIDRNPLGRDVARANARLMAAAPDLYAALGSIIENTDYGAIQDRYIEAARAAMRKARGEA